MAGVHAARMDSGSEATNPARRVVKLSEGITLVRSIEPTGDDMARTRVSPKFQVVIPKEIRERHGLKAGQEMQVISKGNVITLIPDRPLSAFRGILRGMPTSGHREKKDRRL